MKKLLSLALALLMLAVMLPVVSMADEIKWEDGKNVYWRRAISLLKPPLWPKL